MTLLDELDDKNTNIALLEQYKLFVEMTDRNSERRGQTNKYYITVLTALLAFSSWVVTNELLCDIVNTLVLLVSLIGIFLCSIWFIHLRSYKQMSEGKYQIIHEMEGLLPFQCYRREWEILEKGMNHKKYLPYTKIEKFIPIIMAVPYICLFIILLFMIPLS